MCEVTTKEMFWGRPFVVKGSQMEGVLWTKESELVWGIIHHTEISSEHTKYESVINPERKLCGTFSLYSREVITIGDGALRQAMTGTGVLEW